MATGLPDYYSRSYVDIENQTITNLAVDIAKQSLANLDININKQTVTELAIDIAKQTAENLNVNINEQTVSELAIDIAKQTVDNLAVDIGSQSLDTLAIDINKQTIGELSIDIAKQTIGKIFQRPIYGAAQSWGWNGSFDETGLKSIYELSGQGKIYGGYLFIYADDNHLSDKVILKVDEQYYHSMAYEDMFNRGLMGPSISMPMLSYYNQVNYEACCVFNPDITFESGFEIMIYINTDSQVKVRTNVQYALI